MAAIRRRESRSCSSARGFADIRLASRSFRQSPRYAGNRSLTTLGNTHDPLRNHAGRLHRSSCSKRRRRISAANFLRYVDDGFFDGTIFHRIVPGFVIQGGGFTEDMTQKRTKPPIKNEADNGLKNKRGTLSMARTNDINSATSQFFVNLKDNDFLDHSRGNFGYAVFARVTEGMDVIDKIAAVETGRQARFRRCAGRCGHHEERAANQDLTPGVARSKSLLGRLLRGRFGLLVICVLVSVLAVAVAALDQSAVQRIHGRDAGRGLGEPRSRPMCSGIAGST